MEISDPGSSDAIPGFPFNLTTNFDKFFSSHYMLRFFCVNVSYLGLYFRFFEGYDNLDLSLSQQFSYILLK